MLDAGYAASAKQAIKQGAIPEAIESEEKVLCMLEQSVDELAGRLRPIIREEPIGVEPDGPRLEAPIPNKLHQRILAQSTRIRNIRDRIEDIKNSLEL